ncbi:MAG: T9SS type A sorting domain-containing protein [Flavipsychrobacter sp.]|nr:T9SS type A sorting domain-containing protein [Flavipsychrobacter sp.]
MKTRRFNPCNYARLSTFVFLFLLSANKASFAQCDVLTTPNLISACPGDVLPMSTTLTGSNNVLGITWTPAAGLSSATVLNPTLTMPASSGWYHVAVQTTIPGSNLITNGDFTAGNTGFTSAYGFVSNAYNALEPEGHYAIVTNPSLDHPTGASFGDHTSGTGNMMAINGASSPVNVWSQTITVTANTNYAFSAWFSNWSSVTTNLPLLQFTINGTPLGTGSFSIPGAAGLWSQYYATWNSGTYSGAITISIFDSQTAATGNDFAIDDISFSKLCTLTDSVYVDATCPPTCNTVHLPDSISLCMGDSTVIPTTISGPDSVLGISWTPTIGLSNSTVLNPTLTATTSGWYDITVTSLVPGNLVTNGNFTAGNTGFTSAYTFVTNSATALEPAGYYAIVNNPHSDHPTGASFGDHTSGTGNMMAINGASSPVNVWSQTITVSANTNYAFSAWFSNWSSITTNLPLLQFTINGVALGTGSFSIPGAQGLWSQYYATWNSGSYSGPVTINIFDSQTAANGNDFAIDDISFQRICVTKDSVYLNAKNCKHPCADRSSITYTSTTDKNGNCIITATANASSVYQILGYRWSGAGTSVTHYNHTGSDSYTFMLPAGTNVNLSCMVYIVDTTLSDTTGACCQIQLNENITCLQKGGLVKKASDDIQQNYTLYPNPTSSLLHIVQANHDENPVQAEIVSADGRSVFKSNLSFTGGTKTLNLQLTPGLYVLSLRDAESKSYTVKFTIN